VSDEGFLSRWSRRKAQQQHGGRDAVADASPVAPAPPSVVPQTVVDVPPAAPAAVSNAQPAPAEPPAPALPTMDDVAALTRESDYSRFVAPGVDDGIKRAAMKKLFSDPHFNVMDGLDTYIDDYNKPDPIPLAMLRQLNQSKLLRLFDDEDEQGDQAADNPPAPAQASAPSPQWDATASEPIADDHDADLQLQPDDDAGRSGPEPGPRA